MGNYALIKSGKVVNTIVWDGPEISPVDFGEGVTAIEIQDGQTVNIGYTYTDGAFIAPPPTEEELAEQEINKQVANASKKVSLMSEATLRISVLQDAVDLEMATEEEALMLTAWNKYRVLVSRINADTPEEIDWPEQPQ